MANALNKLQEMLYEEQEFLQEVVMLSLSKHLCRSGKRPLDKLGVTD